MRYNRSKRAEQGIFAESLNNSSASCVESQQAWAQSLYGSVNASLEAILNRKGVCNKLVN